MAAIYISKLNPELKKNIKEQNYSVEQMKVIKAKLEEEMNKRQKKVRLVLIILMCIIIYMAMTMFMLMGATPVFFITLGMTIIFSAIAIFGAWVAGMGLVKKQYNDLVMNSYLNYSDELCIK